MQPNNTEETSWSENHEPDSDPVCLVTPPLPDVNPSHPFLGGSKIDLKSMSGRERAFIASVLRHAADMVEGPQPSRASRREVTSMFKNLALAGQLVVQVSRVPVGTEDLDS